jgi:sulfite oxidase
MITTQQIIRTSHPLNSEPELSDLVKDFISTDVNLFNRNHGPFTVLTDAALVTISVDPMARSAYPTVFNDKTDETRSISKLKSMTPTTVNATLMCAGNRRSEMNDIKAVEGVLWDRGVIGSAIWTGLKLRELLVLFINLLPSHEDDDGDAKGKGRYDGLHVHFEADQICEEETERKDYSASIPLAYAM